MRLPHNHITVDPSRAEVEHSKASSKMFDLMEAFIQTPQSPMSTNLVSTEAPEGH